MKNFNLYLVTVGLVMMAATADAARMEDEMDIKKPQIQSSQPQQSTDRFSGKLSVQAPGGEKVRTDSVSNPRTGEPMTSTRPDKFIGYPRGS